MTTLRDEFVDLCREMRGLPDWIAWRLDAFATKLRDRGLSPDVLTALREELGVEP